MTVGSARRGKQNGNDTDCCEPSSSQFHDCSFPHPFCLRLSVKHFEVKIAKEDSESSLRGVKCHPAESPKGVNAQANGGEAKPIRSTMSFPDPEIFPKFS